MCDDIASQAEAAHRPSAAANSPRSAISTTAPPSAMISNDVRQ